MLPSWQALLQDDDDILLRSQMQILLAVVEGGNPLKFEFWDQFGSDTLPTGSKEMEGMQELLEVKLEGVKKQ